MLCSKKWLLMTALVLFAHLADAQSPRIFFDLGAGIPLGSFGGTDDLDNDGFAKVGFGYRVGFDFEVAKWHRVGLLTGISSFNVDDEAIPFVDAISNYRTIPFFLYYAPHFDLIADKLDFESQLRTGLVVNRLPGTTSIFGNTASELSCNFGLGFNFGVNYKLSESLTAGLNWGWMLNQAQFDDSGDLGMSQYSVNARLGVLF